VLSLIPLAGAGLVTMHSFDGSGYFFTRQLVFLVIGFCVFFGASFLDWRLLRRGGVLMALYGFFLLLLGILLLGGERIQGAKSWLSFGSFTVQPADFVKILLVAMLAKYFSRRHVEIAHFQHILVSGIYTLIPFLLVALQPDFGSAVIIFCIWFALIIVSGVSKKHLAIVFTLLLCAMLTLWLFVFADYQKARLISFVEPMSDIHGSGYNAFQSQIAVGAGELLGKGVGYGTQSRLEFLPEYQTDFIFAAFVEEWGLVGAVIMLSLYGVIIVRVLLVSRAGATNFESLFGIGIATMLISHITINIGMNVGLLPVTGLTLPFVSYGGSHLVTEFLGLGILMGMRRYGRESRLVEREVDLSS